MRIISWTTKETVARIARKATPSAFGESFTVHIEAFRRQLSVVVDGVTVYEGDDLEKAQALQEEWLARMFGDARG